MFTNGSSNHSSSWLILKHPAGSPPAERQSDYPSDLDVDGFLTLLSPIAAERKCETCLKQLAHQNINQPVTELGRLKENRLLSQNHSGESGCVLSRSTHSAAAFFVSALSMLPSLFRGVTTSEADVMSRVLLLVTKR